MKDGSMTKMGASPRENVILNARKILKCANIRVLPPSKHKVFKEVRVAILGSKEFLPKQRSLNAISYEDYFEIPLDSKKGIQGIFNTLKKHNTRFADVVLYGAVLEERLFMEIQDTKPVITLWKDIETGAWHHCALVLSTQTGLCPWSGLDLQEGMRYLFIGKVWNQYPSGTRIIAVPHIS